jgi:hypothetical protein
VWVIPGLEFAARVNNEIGQGSGPPDMRKVTIVFMSNVRPEKLEAARSRALTAVTVAFPTPDDPVSQRSPTSAWKR